MPTGNYWTKLREAFRKQRKLVITLRIELRLLSSCFLFVLSDGICPPLHNARETKAARTSFGEAKYFLKPVFGSLFSSYELCAIRFTWHAMRGLSHEHEIYTDLALFSVKLQTNNGQAHTRLFSPHSATVKLGKDAWAQILREDIAIQTGKRGRMFMIRMLSQALGTGGGSPLPSQINRGEMSELRTVVFAGKDQQMLCIVLRPYEG